MRKHKLPDQFQNLTGDQLELLHSWLAKCSYRQIIEKLRNQFGIEIGAAQLCRYYQRLRDLEEFNRGSDQNITLPDLVAMQNGDPIPDAALNQQLLQLQCYRAAKNPNITVSSLAQIHQIATWEQRSKFVQDRLALERSWDELRRQRFELRQIQVLSALARTEAASSPDFQELPECDHSEETRIAS